MALATALMGPVTLRFPRNWYWWILGSLLGMMLWLIMSHPPAGRPLASAPQSVWVEGVIVDFKLSSDTPRLHLATTDSREVVVALSRSRTSVVYDGTVLSLAHLRLGELVGVRSIRQNGEPVARTIEILKTPQQLELGPRVLPLR